MMRKRLSALLIVFLSLVLCLSVLGNALEAATVVTLNKNGGKGGTNSVTVSNGANMPLITVPTYAIESTYPTYIFIGYYDVPATMGGTQYYDASGVGVRKWDKNVSSSMLYARWGAVFPETVTLNKNGGTGGTNSVSVAIGFDMPLIIVPTRQGYVFQGYYHYNWSENVQYYNASGVGVRKWDGLGGGIISSYKVLNARWEACDTVTLNKAGGSGGTDSFSVAIGADMPRIIVPTRQGYVFLGYYHHDGARDVQYYNASGVGVRKWDGLGGGIISSYKMLSARWVAGNTVSFNKNGGSGGTNSVTVAYGDNLPRIIAPTRQGYTFQGYYSFAENGKHVQYYNASGVGIRKWDRYENYFTLFAQWNGTTNPGFRTIW